MLFFIRQFAENGRRSLGRSLWSSAAADKIFNAVTAVENLPFAGNFHAVFHAAGADLRNIGKAGQNAVAVNVAQAALYVVFCIELRVNLTVFHAKIGEGFHFGGDF